jgi:hypothetical protein
MAWKADDYFVTEHATFVGLSKGTARVVLTGAPQAIQQLLTDLGCPIPQPTSTIVGDRHTLTERHNRTTND